MRAPDAVRQDAQLLYDFLSGGADWPGQADFVLAMGSQDLNVPDTAVRAFRATQAQWLVCSGGFGKDTAALFQEPEAVLYARRCAALGVPEDRILLEPTASNSGENFRFSRALLEARGIFPETGVIAAKPYMARRAWATAVWQWPQVQWSVAPTGITFSQYLDQGNQWDTVLNLMTGDLQRLRVYAGTYQAPVDVPEDVWAAHERLAADGFSRHILR